MSLLKKFKQVSEKKSNISYNLKANEIYNLSNYDFDKLIYMIQTQQNIPYKVIQLIREIDRLRFTDMTEYKLQLKLNIIQNLYDKD